jgi:hypothetical protein
MSYNPTIDFLGLMRLSSEGVDESRMPGLDYIASALSRLGLISLFVGQTAPIVNQTTTVWLQPAAPSWTAEGVVRLYDAITQSWLQATPALWSALLTEAITPPAPSRDYVFQNVIDSAATVSAETTLLAVTRSNPNVTTLQLPSVAEAAKELRIIDWSTDVAAHQIIINPAAGQAIMQRNTWGIFSTADQLAGVTLYPSTDLNGWSIP